MKQLQKWFDQLAGIQHEEIERLARVRRIYEKNGPDLSHFQMPACWRRKARIGRAF